MSKNIVNKKVTYLQLCSKCKSTFSTRKELIEHLNKCFVSGQKDVKVDRTRFLEAKSISCKKDVIVANTKPSIDVFLKPELKLKFVKNETQYVVMGKKSGDNKPSQDQIENLKMYNLRPVNTNVNTKRVVKNDADSSSFNDHSDSSNSSSSGLQRNSNLASGSLVSVKKNDALRYQNSSPEPSGSDNMPQLLKHSSNPDMPRIKYYGSLRNNSNFSKMSTGTTTVTSVMNNSSGNNTSNSSNGPMTRLRRSANEAQNSAHVLNLQQKKPSFVIESKKVSISNSSALTQRNSNGNNSSNQSSTMIDLSSDEENEQKYKDKVTSPPCKKPKADSPDVASQFGIPILDFNHDETIRKCSQHGITAFIPLKALNSNEPSELCLPLIQVKDFERKRFLFSTNRFLRIGSIKSVNK